MGDRLRVGLIGCGGMGAEHLKIMGRTPGVEIVGVCDEYAPAAERAGANCGVPHWSDVGRFLDEARPQAVHVCSPSGRHADHAIAAAGRGIHVLCEKPLDINLGKVDRLIALCDASGVRLGCVFQRRTSRAMQAVQQAVANGEMGEILSCSAAIKWWRSQEYYDSSPWRGTWALDGGALANQGIHSLDTMVWMAGPVAEVEYARLDTRMHQMEAEDFALVVVRFESGARGTIEATTCCRPDLASRIEIYGTRGSAAFQDARVLAFGLDGEDRLPSLEDRGMLTGGGSDPWAISFAGHEAQIADFYAAVREGRPPLVDGREARASVDLLHKIYARAFPHLTLGTPAD